MNGYNAQAAEFEINRLQECCASYRATIETLTTERDALAQENKRLREALCDFYSAWAAGHNFVAVSAIEIARPLYETALATTKEKKS